MEADSPGQGHGAPFTVRLPATQAAGVGAPERRRHAAGRYRCPPLGVRVLVVDDERDARDAIATVLELCGAEVETATVSSVADAVASLARSKPDAIVSDIAMPTEDGFALIRQLRESVEGGANVRALALTAYASAADERRILAAGSTRT